MPSAYEKAGVSLEAGYESVRLIKSHVARTNRAGVMGSIGGFGGMFDLASLGYSEPVLISGTDGVGTKILIAQQLGIHNTIGIDAVAMCVNDIVAQGAHPLFFLDYIACGHNDPKTIEQIVSGVADGCVQAGAALIGGETAEMLGVYGADEYDLAGFAVGAVEKHKIIDGHTISAGDVLIGLDSSGLHSNGFSLVRNVFGDEVRPDLLTPTRIYVETLMGAFDAGLVKGAAHITGGGFIENIPRMLPEGLSARIDRSTWQIPEIFTEVAARGHLEMTELFNVLNMGIGMVLALAPDNVDAALNIIGEGRVIGKVTCDSPAITFIN